MVAQEFHMLFHHIDFPVHIKTRTQAFKNENYEIRYRSVSCSTNKAKKLFFCENISKNNL